MTHFLPFKTHIFLSAVIAAGFLVRSALAADATQTITMDISAGEAPACVTATTGITTVTLNLINLPNGLAKLNVNSYLIPEPDADKLPGGKRSAPPTTQTFIYTIDSSHYYIFTLTYPDSEGTTKKMKWKCGFDDTLSLSVGPL
ncbi:MAG: hypothetical protein JWO80_2406, partial [Bryobacterales bacterium]|nr:hypothetical protein [Bryobacterales bacterium]